MLLADQSEEELRPKSWPLSYTSMIYKLCMLIQLSSSSISRPKVCLGDADDRTLTFPCPSCRCGRSQVLRGHPGLGHTAESRWTGGLVTDQTKLRESPNPYAHDKPSRHLCHSPPLYFIWDSLPLEMVRAGDHCDRRMSRQMLPLLLIFGW